MSSDPKHSRDDQGAEELEDTESSAASALVGLISGADGNLENRGLDPDSPKNAMDLHNELQRVIEEAINTSHTHEDIQHFTGARNLFIQIGNGIASSGFNEVPSYRDSNDFESGNPQPRLYRIFWDIHHVRAAGGDAGAGAPGLMNVSYACDTRLIYFSNYCRS